MTLLDGGGVRVLLGDRTGRELRRVLSGLRHRRGLRRDRGPGAAVRERPRLVPRLAGREVRVAVFADPHGDALALMSETRGS